MFPARFIHYYHLTTKLLLFHFIVVCMNRCLVSFPVIIILNDELKQISVVQIIQQGVILFPLS